MAIAGRYSAVGMECRCLDDLPSWAGAFSASSGAVVNRSAEWSSRGRRSWNRWSSMVYGAWTLFALGVAWAADGKPTGR